MRCNFRFSVQLTHMQIMPECYFYLSGMFEYITAEILELAGNAARDNRRVRLTPYHLRLAVMHDAELAPMLETLLGNEITPRRLQMYREVR